MHENVPVRFGRGRLDSLGNKGLAAYLIATHYDSATSVDHTDARNSAAPSIRADADCISAVTANSPGVGAPVANACFGVLAKFLRLDARSAAIAPQTRRIGSRGVDWPA